MALLARLFLSRPMQARRVAAFVGIVSVMATALVVVAPSARAVDNATTIFISELHYDNDGVDVGEFVELTGPAGASLAGWQLVPYNGNGGSAYSVVSLDGVFEDQADGLGAQAVSIGGLQNGSPDGVALVDPANTVVQFLSYEGVFDATDGPANGLTSTDIGVSESGATPIGLSLQLIDGVWAGPGSQSPGMVNGVIGGGGERATFPFVETFDTDCEANGWQIISVDADADDTWSCSTQFSNADVNAFGGSAPADDWFISPAFDMDAQTGETLEFRNYTNFADDIHPRLEVLFAQDFDGEDPNAASWLALSGINFSPQDSAEWVDSGVIDLSGISGGSVNFAFHYTSSGNGAGSTSNWRLDQIEFGPLEVIEATRAKIHEVQGSGDSVSITTLVEIEGVVTSLFEQGDVLDGFFLQEQDADADADPATSEAIFVFCRGNCPDVDVGHLVTVTGTPNEFQAMSQIDMTGGTAVVGPADQPLPTPAPVTLPSSGRTDAEATFEAVEAMVVTFPDELFVSEYFELARFGQLVLTQGGVPFQFTDANAPSVAGYAAFLDDLAAKRIILDDDNLDQNDAIFGPDADEPFPWPAPGLSATNSVRGGDSITGLTGVMHWSRQGRSANDPNIELAWRVRPIMDDSVTYDFTANNPRPSVPDVGGSITVANFNVLNYFLSIDDGNCADGECRGADSEAELVRQRAKIVNAIVELDADIVGLVEIENDADASLADLVASVNAVAGADTYAAVSTGEIGTDAIKVAFIYKPGTVATSGAAMVLDSSIDPSFNDDKNRPVLIQTFVENATGERLTVAVNHLKSKGSPCDDIGDPGRDDGQANCPGTRTAAAAALAAYLATDPTGSGDADFLIIGDLNAYASEPPITTLEAAGYTDLLDAFVGDDAYTYLFDGQRGYLDYALANEALLPQVTGTAAWNINADEIPILDYNDAIEDAGERSFERESGALDTFDTTPFRSSDHDPVLVGLELASDAGEVTISILHNNDGESKLLPAVDQGFPGVARFVTTMKNLQADAAANSDGVLTLTSGDNFLASKEFSASLDNGAPYFDSIALSGLYDAMALGNHDFDFGPDVAAAFIEGFEPAVPFLSANADFSGEPLLVALEASGRLAGSAIIETGGTQVGVIGAITPSLPAISSPRNVVIDADVAGAVNAEVQSLADAGVDKVILISHLQGVDADRALIPLLSGVDVAIAGGGDELFANPGDSCSVGAVVDGYPALVTDADGNEVPLVTGPGGYRCIGQLDVTFDANGAVVAASGSANAVPLTAIADPVVVADVEAPIAAAVAELTTNVIGESEVPLDGLRPSVRTMSSNEGSLLADALLDAGRRLAGDFGVNLPDVAIQNGGGIRNDSVLPVGDITEGDTFDIAPFSNFVVTTTISRERFKDLLEGAYSGLPAASGRFAQPAGFRVLVDQDAPAREIDPATCALVGDPGSRVVEVTLDDGTPIVVDGEVVVGADLALATIDFLARGGDCYPLDDLGFTALGISYQQALAAFVAGTLGGQITAADYPAEGTDRVSFDVDRPVTTRDALREVQEQLAQVEGELSIAGRLRIRRAVWYLGLVVERDAYWDSDDELSDRRGWLAMRYLRFAVENLTLVDEIDALGADFAIVDTMRILATNKIQEAIDADGRQALIDLATRSIANADAAVEANNLGFAARRFGLAWLVARLAF